MDTSTVRVFCTVPTSGDGDDGLVRPCLNQRDVCAQLLTESAQMMKTCGSGICV